MPPPNPYSLSHLGYEQGEAACIHPTRTNDPFDMHRYGSPGESKATGGVPSPSSMMIGWYCHLSQGIVG